MSAAPPMPPPLPAAATALVPGRGEMFYRHIDGRADRPTVVLLHGWMATADLNFHTLYPALDADGWNVIAPDLRGHGRGLLSEAPFTIEDAADDVAGLIDVLGIARAVVVGYSLGGAVAQTLAVRRPDLVSGLVIGGSSLHWRRHLVHRFLARRGGFHNIVQRATSGRWLAHRIVSRAARRNSGVERHRAWLVAEWERGHPGALRTAGTALGKFDGRGLVDRVSAPVVAIVTTRDHLVRTTRQRELAEAYRATVIEIDADHDAPVANPEAFVAAVMNAITTHQAAAPVGSTGSGGLIPVHRT
jgi:pimeloyl-ACP methyl ester carboxylesterase